MKKYIFLILITLSSFSYGQSRSDTESFIEEQITAFPQRDGNGNSNKNSMSFEKNASEEHLFIYHKYTRPIEQWNSQSFPLKQVKSIVLDKTSTKDTFTIVVNLKPNSGAWQQREGEEKNDVDQVTISISSAAAAYDYAERIVVAMEHLVALSGGVMIKEQH